MNATTIQAYALEKGVNFDWNTASNAEKSQLAMQMFFERTTQYAGNFARESSETISGSLGAMKAAFSNVLGNLTLGNDIAPSLSALMESIKTFITGNLIPALGNIFSGLPQILLGAVDIVSSIGQSILSGLPGLVENAAQIGMTIIQSLLEKLPEMTQTGIDLVKNLGQGLSQSLPEIISQALPLLLEFTGSLRENFGLLVDSALQMIITIAQGLISALPQLIEYVPQIVTNICGLINDNAPKLIQTALVLLVELGKGLIQAIPTLIKNIPQIIQAIISVFTAFNWLNVGKQAIQGIGNGIKGMVSFIKNSAKTIFDAVKNGFSSLPSALTQIGKNLVQGLWNGISSMFNWVVNLVRGFAGSVISSIKSIFGIHSPSTVMANIGEMLDKGLAGGIENNLRPIRKAVDEVAKITAGTLESELAVSTAVGADYSSYSSSGYDRYAYAAENLANHITTTKNEIIAGLRDVVYAIQDKDTDSYLDGQKVTRSITQIQNRTNRMYGHTLQNV